uniref:Uncharacterized protein n=1 Tax=Arundo donax TaxID=35708 RepID=A0A0A9BEM2_ARUDO
MNFEFNDITCFTYFTSPVCNLSLDRLASIM